jgi:hypothetical protein
MDLPMRNLLMSQIAKLHRMPDLSKAMEEYKPEPDPFAEKMKELEVRKTEVEIFERETRAQENLVDMENKKTQAMLNRAKTRQLLSDTDIKDLDFTRTADGTKHREEMDKKAADHLTAVSTNRGDNATKLAIAAQKPAAAK